MKEEILAMLEAETAVEEEDPAAGSVEKVTSREIVPAPSLEEAEITLGAAGAEKKGTLPKTAPTNLQEITGVEIVKR